MAGYMRGVEKLQGLPVVPCIHVDILLAMLWGHFRLAME